MFIFFCFGDSCDLSALDLTKQKFEIIHSFENSVSCISDKLKDW